MMGVKGYALLVVAMAICASAPAASVGVQELDGAELGQTEPAGSPIELGLAQEIMKASASVDPKHRAAFIHGYWGGASAAGKAKCNPKKWKRRIRRIVKRVRKRVKARTSKFWRARNRKFWMEIQKLKKELEKAKSASKEVAMPMVPSGKKQWSDYEVDTLFTKEGKEFAGGDRFWGCKRNCKYNARRFFDSATTDKFNDLWKYYFGNTNTLIVRGKMSWQQWQNKKNTYGKPRQNACNMVTKYEEKLARAMYRSLTIWERLENFSSGILNWMYGAPKTNDLKRTARQMKIAIKRYKKMCPCWITYARLKRQYGTCAGLMGGTSKFWRQNRCPSMMARMPNICNGMIKPAFDYNGYYPKRGGFMRNRKGVRSRMWKLRFRWSTTGSARINKLVSKYDGQKHNFFGITISGKTRRKRAKTGSSEGHRIAR